MRNTAILVCLSIVGLFAGGAHAEPFRPLQSATFDFRDHVASVYYLERGESFHVVTTLAPKFDRAGSPMRFTAALREGQTQTVSIGGFGPEHGAVTLLIERTGKVVTAELIDPGSMRTQ